MTRYTPRVPPWYPTVIDLGLTGDPPEVALGGRWVMTASAFPRLVSMALLSLLVLAVGPTSCPTVVLLLLHLLLLLLLPQTPRGIRRIHPPNP